MSLKLYLTVRPLANRQITCLLKEPFPFGEPLFPPSFWLGPTALPLLKGGVVSRRLTGEVMLPYASGAGQEFPMYTMESSVNTYACTKPENRSK